MAATATMALDSQSGGRGPFMLRFLEAAAAVGGLLLACCGVPLLYGVACQVVPSYGQAIDWLVQKRARAESSPTEDVGKEEQVIRANVEVALAKQDVVRLKNELAQARQAKSQAENEATQARREARMLRNENISRRL
ncbi:uncharacterized protein MYCFIDRAFT_203956 [Pseudocercospora fijiensis CIRAD86]|uniref:Uncharacterized protein n=1 Tax=Pseudocercospora fijiensis (strain CIRAD86) TaxID=383855 RepID=M2YX26_PSEFD|nr:uncharacterized protein MYCFIDRAFT_203956 [Pseudocercospora fijiensis CIRAD86]EME82240.1 hypothetical protein MYCFIDRAFT_203956 [Pseudocercospora fijiensis CIRAD86]